jgi:MoxR-like ATPase
MQKAEVVFLDEVFNASSAILNALLTFMNERKFHDRGKIVRTPLRLLVSATNHTPREDGLAAVYDRFLLRARLSEVQVEDLETLMQMGWSETHALHGAMADATVMHGLLDQLLRYQTDVDEMTNAGKLQVEDEQGLIRHLKDFVATLRRAELSRMSNRRIVKFMGIFLAEALLRHARSDGAGQPSVEPRDLQVLLDFGLDTQDDGIVSRLREHLTGR